MPAAHDAATVILLRDGAAGLETLLLRRNSRIAFGGMWVFPGGRVDETDRTGLPPDDALGAARRAAVREAQEEAGLIVPEGLLVPLSHWTPPPQAPKRFLTWFFLAPADASPVTIDRGEIHEHAWVRPADALARRDALEIDLAPPTWVTLHWLAQQPEVEGALAEARLRDPEPFATHIASSPDGPVAVWQDDAAYETGDLDAPGPRHRLRMSPAGWRYERR
jgi:8-oxo-dGTP pyrophosphatase MutT (NUDIX family)